MDRADDELRITIRAIWPLQAKKMLDLLIPRKDGKENTIRILLITHSVYNNCCCCCCFRNIERQA